MAIVIKKSIIYVMSRKDLLGVLKYFKKTEAQEMIKIARERRAHHREAIEELKQENQYLKKKMLKQYKQNLGAGRFQKINKNENKRLN